MSARFNANVLIILGADLAQLECGAHLTVEFVLLLRYLNKIEINKKFISQCHYRHH